MRRLPKYSSTCLALAACGLVLTACGSRGADATQDADYSRSAKLSGQLKILGFGGDDEIGQVRLDEAKKALGSKVTLKQAKGDLDVQQFLSSVASGDSPDLVYADRNQIGTFAARGAIVPLDACIKGEGIDTTTFRRPALDEVTLKGKVYAIPEFNVVQIVQANSDLLRRAGLTVADVDGHDWSAMTAANRALEQEDGGKLTVIGVDPKLPEFFPLWAKANGTDLISADGKKAQLDDPRAVEALKWAVDMYDAQGGFGKVKAFRDSADFFGKGNQFASNTLGAMPMEQWYVNVLNDVSPSAPMAFSTVRDHDDQPLAFATGSSWAIPKGAEHPEAACRFARVMTQTSSWVKAAQERVRLRQKDGGLFTGVLTGNVKADDAIQAMVKPSDGKVWDQAVQATYAANDHTFSMPATPAGSEFESAWQDAVNRVLNGQQSAEKALEQGQKEAQDALDQGWQELDR